MNQKLKILGEMPPKFFDITVRNICDVFPEPTLIQLEGAAAEPIFLSILLHGNEYTGFDVMQQLLAKYQTGLPRPINLFVGNVRAAELNCRVLPDQTDFNRCWPGTDDAPLEARHLMQQVMDRVTSTRPFAAIDFHNNTGPSPHYACITDVTPENMAIASMFNRIALIFHYPRGVSTMAFDGLCPAIALECGEPGARSGTRIALDFIDSLINLKQIPKKTTDDDLHLVESHSRVSIPQDASFEFDHASSADVTFDTRFESRNFTLMHSDEVFAHTRIGNPFSITDQQGKDVTNKVVRILDGKVYLKKAYMPAMISPDKEIVQQDCLCYLLQDYKA